MSKRFTIFVDPMNEKPNFYDDAFTLREAKRKAQKAFKQRYDRNSDIYIEEQREVFRLSPKSIGFNVGETM